MGLQTAFLNLLASPTRTLRIIKMKIILILHLILSFVPFFKNYNLRKQNSGIPQPAYYNSWKDVRAASTFFGLLWINNLSEHLQEDRVFDEKLNQFNYDAIVKAYFPTKITALESVNIERTWENSYWNEQNKNNQKSLRMSDIKFADMMSNTQEIYKIKRVKPQSQIREKVIDFFEDILEKNRNKFSESEIGKSVIDSLINAKNLYYIDYEAQRKSHQGEEQNAKGSAKYSRQMTTSKGNKVTAYYEIPFAIFAEVEGYVEREGKYLLCLAAVFNETFYKTKHDNINYEKEVFHTFIENPKDRDRWQMAKEHMASVDTNDFTVRTHLGVLHYASSIYTCAFTNLSNQKKSWKWLVNEFVNIFSVGVLQINFMANLTLMDHKEPMAERVFYLDRARSAKIVTKQNSKFNPMQFDPDHLGEDSYESDSIKVSRAYYKKLEIYINYLFDRYEGTWVGQTKRMGQFLLNELRDKNGKFDSISQEIAEDTTPNSLKKLMTNLAFLWVVRHGQTFSLVSVANSFYFVPPMLRKPLSSLPDRQLTASQKQQWLPHKEIIKDSMTLHKVVTFRTDKESIVSAWSELKINQQVWMNTLRKREGVRDKTKLCYQDFWNNITLDHMTVNSNRTERGLYNLHWLMPHELPIALNI